MRTVTILLTLLAFCSQAYGLTFMGPPKAELDQGQYSLGFDYTFSEMDLELSGYGDSWTAKGIEAKTLFSNFGYGITDNWEGFFRLGFVNIKSEYFFSDFVSGNEFAYGFGTKFIFAEQNSVSWGTLFQIGWLTGEDTITGFLPGFGIVTVDMEIDAYEIQIAVGPTYEANGLKIYGGPFFHFVDGDLDIADVFGSESFDIEEESVFGGYIGLTADLTSNSDIGVEFQFTGDAQAVGLRYVHRF